MSFQHLVATVLIACSGATHAACQTAPGRFLALGDEVTDQKTGLVWARCSVGQVLSVGSFGIGSACTGDPSFLTHEQALSYAQARSGWRLPNVKELASLVQTCQTPTIDIDVFPNTWTGRYMSSSPYVESASLVWTVDFSDGSVGSYYRIYPSAVRLVRASP
jgi:Protein of unknown function (DUF1566)